MLQQRITKRQDSVTSCAPLLLPTHRSTYPSQHLRPSTPDSRPRTATVSLSSQLSLCPGADRILLSLRQFTAPRTGCRLLLLGQNAVFAGWGDGKDGLDGVEWWVGRVCGTGEGLGGLAGWVWGGNTNNSERQCCCIAIAKSESQATALLPDRTC